MSDQLAAADDRIVGDLRGARVLFSTRAGGVSTGAYDSLNLGRATDDDSANVDRNRDRLAAAIGRPREAILCVRQVHGTTVRHATAPVARAPEADGIVTALPGTPALVLTADCLAIMLSDGATVAALHAGWRGLADGIVAAGVSALALGDGVAAALGPCARGCCYEVGDEVHARFPGARVGARNLDLAQIARDQLAGLGVTEILDTGICTICDERFYSHRRDRGVTGRQAAVIWRS